MKNQSITFILAIDAGGTKTLGLLKCLGTEQTWSKRTASASLSHDLDKSCKRIDELAKALLIEASCDAKNTLLVCGVAGGGNHLKRQSLFERLSLSFPKVRIYNDGITSLYGAGRGKPVIVLAMGTGSIATRLDDRGTVSRFGGWGFTAGDLGSGAYMGKQLVSNALVQYDKRQIKCDILLSETISRLSNVAESEGDKPHLRMERGNENNEEENTNQAIANWIQTATATEYASFAPLIFEYAEQSEYAIKIINDAAYWIEDLARTAGFKSKEFGDLDIVIIGGLSQAIKPYLSDNLSNALIPAKGSSLDGAIYIGEKILKVNTIL